MVQAFNDADMRQAHADAVKSVAARNNLPAKEKEADQARTLAWLNKTFIDPEMQKAYEEAVKSEEARKSESLPAKKTAWRSIFRWMSIK